MSVLALLGCLPLAEFCLGTGGECEAQPVSTAGDIEVSPASIDFGAVEVGGPVSATEVVTVGNVGDATLSIRDVAVEDASQPFTLSFLSSTVIAPGMAASFGITFEPDAPAEFSTRIVIESDDPDEPQVHVGLIGGGLSPSIEIEPSNYDFGTLYVGCTETHAVEIRNAGNADLVVSDLASLTGASDLNFDPDEPVNGGLPWTLAGGASLTVFVDYVPLDDEADRGTLFISSNDPSRPTVLSRLVGASVVHGEVVDVFEQPAEGPTDILFALDRSCSMDEEILRFRAAMDAFLLALEEIGVDYHVAVVTADDGCVSGSRAWIDGTMSTADRVAAFDEMVDGGTVGSNTDAGFTLLEAALTSGNTGGGGCNEGVVRDEASLSLIGVTDATEQSSNPWSTYVSLFQAMKPDPDDVVFHAIAGDYPSGCGDSEPREGWYEATVATGGSFLSICATDQETNLTELAEGSVADLSSFELSLWPVPETIVVSVDGFGVTAGWTYNSTHNTVDFDELSTPQGGATVEVAYATYGDCGP